MKYNIGIDLDGVVCNLYHGAFKVLKDMYPKQVKTDVFNCNWEKQYGLTEKQVRNCFIRCAQDGLLNTAPIYEGAKRALYKIRYKYNIQIVTWRNYMPNAKEDTLYWLDSNKIPYDKLVMSKTKFDVAVKENFCFFLDDSPSICNRMAKTVVPTFIFRRPWNQEEPLDALVKVIRSWNEVPRLLLPYRQR